MRSLGPCSSRVLAKVKFVLGKVPISSPTRQIPKPAFEKALETHTRVSKTDLSQDLLTWNDESAYAALGRKTATSFRTIDFKQNVCLHKIWFLTAGFIIIIFLSIYRMNEEWVASGKTRLRLWVKGAGKGTREQFIKILRAGTIFRTEATPDVVCKRAMVKTPRLRTGGAELADCFPGEDFRLLKIFSSSQIGTH